MLYHFLAGLLAVFSCSVQSFPLSPVLTFLAPLLSMSLSRPLVSILATSLICLFLLHPFIGLYFPIFSCSGWFLYSWSFPSLYPPDILLRYPLYPFLVFNLFLFVPLEFSGRRLPLSSSIFLLVRCSIALRFQFVCWLGLLSIAFHFAIALARKMNLAFIGFEQNVWGTYTLTDTHTLQPYIGCMNSKRASRKKRFRVFVEIFYICRFSFVFIFISLVLFYFIYSCCVVSVIVLNSW